MLGVKNGDTQKLGLLYERYKKGLFNFFYQLCGERDLSEDMVQNVFMRILKYKHTYSEDSKYVTWMFQIARNVNNDHFRKNKKHQQLTRHDPQKGGVGRQYASQTHGGSLQRPGSPGEGSAGQ